MVLFILCMCICTLFGNIVTEITIFSRCRKLQVCDQDVCIVPLIDHISRHRYETVGILRNERNYIANK